MERNANAYYELASATVELMNERIQCDRIESEDDCSFSDALHEVIVDQVPHYYHEIFTVMAADGIDFEFNDSGLMPDTKDVTVILQARIYEALYNDVPNDCGLVWFEEEEVEDKMCYVLFYTNFQGVDEYEGVYSTREEAQARIECFGKDDQLSFHIEEEYLG